MDTTNKPRAWMDKRTNKCVVFINTPPSDDWIPLYTHPAELTDEEIVSLYESSYLQVSGYFDEWEFDPVYFARAVLRKAQKK
jgi:hypothetical protein